MRRSRLEEVVAGMLTEDDWVLTVVSLTVTVTLPDCPAIQPIRVALGSTYCPD